MQEVGKVDWLSSCCIFSIKNSISTWNFVWWHYCWKKNRFL